MDRTTRGVSIVVPCYNEEAAIAIVIQRIQDAMAKAAGFLYEIIVVDDGSQDRTAEVAAGRAVRLVRHPKNLGYGKAIVSGIDVAQYDLIAIIDSDETYEPTDLLPMLPLMESFDMVTGVRDMKHVEQNFVVKLMRILLRTIISYFTGVHAPDPNSGLRLFRKDIVTKGRRLFSMKFSFSTSLTVFAHLTNRFVEYVPIHYNSRIGHSKVRHLRDSIRTLMLILSMAAIHRPLKCYAALIFTTVMGFMVLLSLNTLIGMTAWASLMVAWFATTHFTGLAAIAYVLSQIHGALEKE
jgi:glycosyltransferase involved in cell wall biosynthesis